MEKRSAGSEKRPSDPDGIISISDEDTTARKRLKQCRLPFKPLDCKPQTQTKKTPSRKRKLSEESPSTNKPKQPKVPDLKNSSEKVKIPLVNDDNEVSSTSSSETEHSSVSSGTDKTKAGKGNLLETFVRREDEISSTNDVIDLTESVDENIGAPNENSPVKPKSPRKPVSVTKSPRAKPEAATKEKEKGFSRKLAFDKEEPLINETGHVLDKSASADKEQATAPENESMDKSASAEKEQETAPENESMEVCASADETEEGDKKSEEKDSVQKNDSPEKDEDSHSADDKDSPSKGDIDTPSKDDSSSSSDSEESESEPSTPEKEGADDSQSDAKTPALTDTPQTPGSANTSLSSTGGATPTTSGKKPRVLSKKQLDRMAHWKKMKEDKEKAKQAEKAQKEKERREKKRQRDEEKAEKERAKKEEKEKKEKERLEKKEQFEKEKQTKLQQREEEKQKRMEKVNAKLEEKKMKEDEKRQKEEQKQKEEEEKLRQEQKRKQAFTSFFIKPKVVTSTKVSKAAEDNPFIPFELKKDMTLAPVIRHRLTDEQKEHVHNALTSQESGEVTYLQELKQKTRIPKRVNRMLRKKKEIEQEVELWVHDSEAVKKVMHACKLLQFHTDYRPPYFGTWRKNVKGLSPRNPWKKDQDVFDYEVDSDDEWEEEEPGESLSDSNGEEEEGEEVDDDGDDEGWMVPHGYLSEDEGCQDDEDVTPEVLKARQRAKAMAWEAELKAKKQVLPPLHLGCFWLDSPCTAEKHLSIFTEYEMVCLRSSPIETLISCPTLGDPAGDKSSDAASNKTSPTAKGFGGKRRPLPEEAMPDLIRLVHGNYAGIKKLVREFRLFWKQKCSADANLSLDESRVEGDESKVLNDSVMDSSANLDESALDTETKQTVTVLTEEEEPMQTESGDTVEESKNKVVEESENKMEVSEDKAAESSDKVVGVERSEKKQDDSGAGDESTDSGVSKRQLEIKITSIAVREKRAGKKHSWYVSDDVLKQYGLQDLPVDNAWVYVSKDLARSQDKTPKAEVEKKTPTPSSESRPSKSKDLDKSVDSACDADVTSTPKSSKCKKESSAKKTPRDQLSIMAFAKKASAKKIIGDKTKMSTAEKTSKKSPESKKDTENSKAETGANQTTPRDQRSIMAFARKASAKKTTGDKTKKSPGKKIKKSSESKKDTGTDAKEEDTSDVKNKESTAQPTSCEQSGAAEPMDEDCIILD